MQGSDSHKPERMGAGLMLLGATLATASLGAALAAADHMAGANLCGPLTRHCMLCVAATASLLASSGVVASGALLRWGSRFEQPRARRA
jgi:hypothetical protein